MKDCFKDLIHRDAHYHAQNPFKKIFEQSDVPCQVCVTHHRPECHSKSNIPTRMLAVVYNQLQID